MPMPVNLIDSHVHLDLVARHHPRRLQWLRENGCAVVSWAYFETVDSLSDLRRGLDETRDFIREQSSAGLACHFLAGVHPRSIPGDLTPEEIKTLLMPYLQDPLCLGIGEIGLETGDSREREVLLAQLELGREMVSQDFVVGVHTPRSNKIEITRQTLELLRDFAELAPGLVVDHATVDTITPILDAGFWAGVTLSPVKTSWDALQEIARVEADRLERIMTNTDSGTDFYEDAVRLRRNEALPEKIRKQLFYTSAAGFFHFHV